MKTQLLPQPPVATTSVSAPTATCFIAVIYSGGRGGSSTYITWLGERVLSLIAHGAGKSILPRPYNPQVVSGGPLFLLLLTPPLLRQTLVLCLPSPHKQLIVNFCWRSCGAFPARQTKWQLAAAHLTLGSYLNECRWAGDPRPREGNEE